MIVVGGLSGVWGMLLGVLVVLGASEGAPMSCELAHAWVRSGMVYVCERCRAEIGLHRVEQANVEMPPTDPELDDLWIGAFMPEGMFLRGESGCADA